MGTKFDYPRVSKTGIVDNENASLQIISSESKHATLYLYIERLNFSVYKAAVGGGGICTVQTDDGTHIWTVDVDTARDIPSVDFGEFGYKVHDDENVGVQAVLSGADTQASVSVGIVGHYERR